MKQYLTNVHNELECRGQFCCVHNPSNHHMREWPLNWRSDKQVMERICEHGVGHPDPDCAAYLMRTGRGGLTVHGCDGCCNEFKDSK